MSVQERGPWKVERRDGRPVVYSEDFTHDVTLVIAGDFADTDERIAYAEEIARRLNEWYELSALIREEHKP